MRRTLLALAVAAFAVPSAAHAGIESVPTPTVTGPIKAAEGSRPWLSTEIGLADLGYVEEEYFVEGTARSYSGSEPSGEAAYKTRILVRRPVSAERFDGTVVVEWFNVTGGYDAEWDWFSSHEHFTRRGWAWVGVSAQYVGATALHQFNNARYGSLNHPGDNFAADIYAQAAKALRTRTGPDPLGGLAPTLLLADGHSQSADRLAGYYDNQQEADGIFDAFMLRGHQHPIRTDLPTKAVRLLSETDVSPVGQGVNPPGEPDNDHYRRWEIAATSHVTWKEYRESAPLIARDKGSENPRQCVKPPYSRVHFDHAQNALYDHLERWARGGAPPPSSPRIAYASDGHTLERDDRGFAVGGIRLPDLAVPTALQTGENQGVTFCVLYGSREPFSDAELLDRYPDRASYVAKVHAAIKESVEAGYMLPEDAVQLCREAQRAQLGWPDARPLAGDTPCPYETLPAAASDDSGALAAAPTAPLGLPAARRCVRRRQFQIRLRRGLRSAQVFVNGKRVRVLRGRKRLRARIDLRWLPRGVARVVIVARTKKGRTLVQTRRYRACR